MLNFHVTFETITPESAEHGDTDTSGFVAQDVSLREAIADVFETRTAHCDGVIAVEASEYPVSDPRWITVYNGMEFQTGVHENRSLHFPDSMTPASKLRVCRLLGAYGS